MKDKNGNEVLDKTLQTTIRALDANRENNILFPEIYDRRGGRQRAMPLYHQDRDSNGQFDTNNSALREMTEMGRIEIISQDLNSGYLDRSKEPTKLDGRRAKFGERVVGASDTVATREMTFEEYRVQKTIQDQDHAEFTHGTLPVYSSSSAKTVRTYVNTSLS